VSCGLPPAIEWAAACCPSRVPAGSFTHFCCVARLIRRAGSLQWPLLGELSTGGQDGLSLVPDSPGPLSIMRSLRPDRRAAADASSPGGRGGGAKRGGRPLSAVPFALPEAEHGATARRGVARRAMEWALSVLVAALALLLPLLLGLRTDAGPVPLVL
jgi:hypothetical protein